jgi:hypothetical protein
MTFEEILDQAIAMLQRRGRLTYSTLKRQFQLDDAALEDLKNELIEGQRLAVDERGNVLVWMGAAQFHLSSSGITECRGLEQIWLENREFGGYGGEAPFRV